MHSGSTLILTRQDIAGLAEFNDYLEAVEAAFRQHGAGKALLPDLLHMKMPEGTFHIKAAGLELWKPLIAVKVNGNFPQNMERNELPTIQGVIVLCDGSNGSPLAILDSIEITTQRTGAATALAAKLLARPGSRVATICGCGVQGRIQLRALTAVLSLTRVYAFDANEKTAQTFAIQMTKELGFAVDPVSRLEDASKRSDVIVTCTTARQPFLGVNDVVPGTFIAAVGADSEEKQELHPQLLAANTVVVDILEHCANIGELHHAIRHQLITRTDVHAELGEITTGKKPGRTSEDEIIIFDTTGTALQDVAAAAMVYEKALHLGVGYRCSLNS